MACRVYQNTMPVDQGSSEEEHIGEGEHSVSKDGDMTDDWYSNDLQLAAELGKTLLERNRELESSLIQAQHLNDEHTQHVQHLERQLGILREASESKARLYEQLDYNIQEMDKTNHKLVHESKTDKQKIQRLTETIDALEAKVEEQQNIMQEMKLVERERARERRKSRSLPREMNLFQLRRYYSTNNLEEKDSKQNEEIIQLKSTVRYIKSQLSAERRKNDELEIEISVLCQENETMRDHIRELESRIEDARLDDEIDAVSPRAHSSPSVCKLCHKMLNRSDDRSRSFEDSDNSDDESDIIEWDTFVPVHQSHSEPLPVNSSEKDQTAGMSLFGELDAQYHDLMEKYNNLLTNSKKATPPPQEGAAGANGDVRNTAVQTTPMQEKRRSLILDIAKLKEQESAAEDKNLGRMSPPEYKKLFKEIFEVLQKSKIAK
ncbi:cerebellar degeneration-related protein 2-like [Glandiceps talaboti]